MADAKRHEPRELQKGLAIRSPSSTAVYATSKNEKWRRTIYFWGLDSDSNTEKTLQHLEFFKVRLENTARDPLARAKAVDNEHVN